LKAEFVTSATGPERYPTDRLPEIAFLGRSNVGKSSLINVLTGQKKLAFTSNTPGRTQTINFYRIDDKLYFVDLPGYGYARAPKDVLLAWRQFIEKYLLERKTLALSAIVLDARRGWMEHDLELKRWLDHHNRRYLVIATKIDKLNQSEQQRLLASFRDANTQALMFSAVTGRGVRETWQAISKTLNP
jgi:GTP-binding protein